MISKLKDRPIYSFAAKLDLLSICLIVTLIDAIVCKTTQNTPIESNSLPKIITLQTFRDWSSRLGANQTTPQSAALIFEESQEVRTTDYGNGQRPIGLTTSTDTTINNIQSTAFTSSPPTLNTSEANAVNDQNKAVSAHKVAAQVLSRILHISPLLSLASNVVPFHDTTSEFNTTSIPIKTEYMTPLYYETNSIVDKEVTKSPPIESLNEIDVDNSVTPFKSERITASGISFPTTPSTTTLADTTLSIPDTPPTEPTPADYPEEDHNHSHDGEEHEDEDPGHHDHESPPPEESEDYDDEEEESFRHPVRVNFQDPEEDNPAPDAPDLPERDGSPPFVIPNIDINPESLKQKGCRTVVKEVQAIPLEKGLPHNQIHQSGGQSAAKPANKAVVRPKRDTNDNSRKFTSIVMTKECHFPGDEGAGSEERPQTVANAAMSDSKRETTYMTPSPPQGYDDYDMDFDFKPRLSYPSIDLEDRMESKSSEDRKSYVDSPLFRSSSNSEYFPQKDDFGFDDIWNGFQKRSDAPKRRSKKNRKRKLKNPYALPSRYDMDDEDFGPKPKSSRTRSRGSKAPVYRSEKPRLLQDHQQVLTKKNGPKKKKNKKPAKKVNRSFAFFRKAEPKHKDPNESDYSVSYGRGNFQSFSDSYDSDKDGPRAKGKGKAGKGGKGRDVFDDDDDDD